MSRIAPIVTPALITGARIGEIQALRSSVLRGFTNSRTEQPVQSVRQSFDRAVMRAGITSGDVTSIRSDTQPSVG